MEELQVELAVIKEKVENLEKDIAEIRMAAATVVDAVNDLKLNWRVVTIVGGAAIAAGTWVVSNWKVLFATGIIITPIIIEAAWSFNH